jgi:hypothetical protein
MLPRPAIIASSIRLSRNSNRVLLNFRERSTRRDFLLFGVVNSLRTKTPLAPSRVERAIVEPGETASLDKSDQDRGKAWARGLHIHSFLVSRHAASAAA